MIDNNPNHITSCRKDDHWNFFIKDNDINDDVMLLFLAKTCNDFLKINRQNCRANHITKFLLWVSKKIIIILWVGSLCWILSSFFVFSDLILVWHCPFHLFLYAILRRTLLCSNSRTPFPFIISLLLMIIVMIRRTLGRMEQIAARGVESRVTS